ncbi:tRNA-splicing endonuclease subunit Sen34 [Lingula anatina]|uniref:tRNA-splicing endonuclease subunit Sen34 n=1 Tax=Lingula anatina TaxID=7574 RepID=A0A1S3I4E5_LINAN|nr:tRNA-splicing endonuclease subunit Sen34 [Lingula anatina]|eukprot:XP_013393098.1 tRNA-splicing endonuclease subunit Sen34 [Lingula anatina]
MAAEPVKISLVSNKPFIWNAEDACIVLEKYRIVGALAGCLSRAPRQNIQLGLPLQLMPEEAMLLLQEGYAQLVNSDQNAKLPSPEQVDRFQKMREESFKQQAEIGIAERKLIVQRRLDQIKEGRKAKRKQRLEKKKANGQDVDERELMRDEDKLDVKDIQITPMGQEHALVQIFTETPWVEEVDTDVRWDFPSTEEERVRYRVFRDLWRKGHSLTCGGKFGGDFLVYPGDPSRFHSFYIAVCLLHHQTMSAEKVVAMARLGSTVKKTVVLCSVDDDDELTYTSLQWTGIS